jgi:hypothetical protein
MQGTKVAPGMVPQALAMLFAVRPDDTVLAQHSRAACISIYWRSEVYNRWESRESSRYQALTHMLLMQGLQGHTQDFRVAVSNYEVCGQ